MRTIITCAVCVLIATASHAQDEPWGAAKLNFDLPHLIQRFGVSVDCSGPPAATVSCEGTKNGKTKEASCKVTIGKHAEPQYEAQLTVTELPEKRATSDWGPYGVIHEASKVSCDVAPFPLLVTYDCTRPSDDRMNCVVCAGFVSKTCYSLEGTVHRSMR
jgi:hypothetical protein